VHYRRILIMPVVLALAACATPAPQEPAPPPPVQSSPLQAIAFSPPPPSIVLANPFDGTEADLEPLPPSPGDLWDRIVRGYAIPDIHDPLVEKWEQWYAERPDYVARMVERSRRYLYHIVTEVESRGMPSEIALLPVVESAFNPNALSAVS
jgi:membrane-bound lytic murein transglycosylase D